MPRYSLRKSRGVPTLASWMSEPDPKQMLMSFRKQELVAVLQFAGLKTLGKKAELLGRALRMVKKGIPAHVDKVRELYNTTYHNQLSNYFSYPVHPDVQLVGLPFYEVLGELIKPSSLIPTSVVRKQSATFGFHLTPAQTLSLSTIDFSFEVQMRFCQFQDNNLPQEDFFPPDVEVKVNRIPCNLPNPTPSTKAGVEPKRPPVPVNITPLVMLNATVSNEIAVTWSHDCGKAYVIAVYFVRKMASADLLKNLRDKGVRHPAVTIGTIKEKLLGDADCELATTCLKVSLLCPLGKSRMHYPCRATTCKHLQCFDASMYLQMNEKKSTWTCPVCHESALYENLLIDGYFLQVLDSPRLPPECCDIVLCEDGLWAPKVEEPVEPVPEAPVLDLDNDECMIIECKPIKPEKLERSVKSPQPTSEIQVVDLISSDEEDVDVCLKAIENSPTFNIPPLSETITLDSPSSSSSSTDSASSTVL